MQQNHFSGLANLGNTCFLNSCLQVLNATYELDILNSVDIIHDLPDTILLKEWRDIKKIMTESPQGSVISPNRFVYMVQQVSEQKNKLLFTGWSQNDFCEFLLLWMECIHNSISRKLRIKINGNPENKKDEMAIQCYKCLQNIYAKDYSEMYDLFYGMYMTTIYDKDKNAALSMKPEHFFILDMQLFKMEENQAFTNAALFHDIYQLFDNYIEMEFMHGENAWYNEKTGNKEDIYKTTTFWSLPKILVICLKRFSTDGKRKLQHPIHFPLENLNLSKYVKGYQSKKYVYNLYGVCNHFGGVQGGHYTAFVKHGANNWLHYNDNSVEQIDESRIVSPSAYCLFYRKNDSMQDI